ncbi:MAG: glycosyl transferase [Patescibacteria group bacterium]|nr:MAG: glycosyl transferase [Patescibacteria group bacterium]
MKIVFLTPRFFPDIGGVEKHCFELSKRFVELGHKVTVVTAKSNVKQRDFEVVENIIVKRFSYHRVKFFGLLMIWFKLLGLNKLFRQADIIHIHDVVIWYLPLRVFLLNKKIYATFHGWEGKYPIPFVNILLKKFSRVLAYKVICIGSFIEKYYGVSADKVIYGGVDLRKFKVGKKVEGCLVYLGRLEKDTGLLKFLAWYKKNKSKYPNLLFCGDGSLKDLCQNYGKVLGFVDPLPYLKSAELCVPGGYLSALEALSCGCKLKLFWHNPVKKDYWLLSPFYSFQFSQKNLRAFLQGSDWSNIAKIYLKLWQKS